MSVSKNSSEFKWKIVEVKSGDSIRYLDFTKDYGRAEFEVCPVWKRGKLHELWISRLQQTEQDDEMYHISCGFSTGIFLDDKAYPWMMHWCPLHKTTGFRIYVPRGTNRLVVDLLSTASLLFIP